MRTLIITPTTIYGRVRDYYMGEFIVAVKSHLAWMEGVTILPSSVHSVHLRWSTWTDGRVRKAGYVECEGGRRGAMPCYKVQLGDIQKGVPNAKVD